MINLGEKIKLEGFDNIEPYKLTVIKKIVGNFVKKLESDNKVSLSLNLEQENNEFSIKAELTINDKKTNSEVKEKNLFFALNKALESLNA